MEKIDQNNIEQDNNDISKPVTSCDLANNEEQHFPDVKYELPDAFECLEKADVNLFDYETVIEKRTELGPFIANSKLTEKNIKCKYEFDDILGQKYIYIGHIHPK